MNPDNLRAVSYLIWFLAFYPGLFMFIGALFRRYKGKPPLAAWATMPTLMALGVLNWLVPGLGGWILIGALILLMAWMIRQASQGKLTD